MSGAAQRYFAAGGRSMLIGDGQLKYGTERIVESYYALRASSHLTLSADYQYVVNPAYNRDRGPVSLLGFRIHADFRANGVTGLVTPSSQPRHNGALPHRYRRAHDAKGTGDISL